MSKATESCTSAGTTQIENERRCQRGTGWETEVGICKEIREKIWTDGECEQKQSLDPNPVCENARSSGGGEPKGRLHPYSHTEG